jgi:hypothetical protein
MSSCRVSFATALLIAVVVVCPNGLRAQRAATSLPSTAPELDELLASKESGLLTDWRIAGPFGKYGELEKSWAPERDQLRKTHYGDKKVETTQFPTGKFVLPERFPKKGVFYASSEVWIPNGGEWRIYAETAGTMVVFIDGKQVIERSSDKNNLSTTSEVIHLQHGTHRVLVKFTANASPFHLAVMPQTGGLRKKNNIPDLHQKVESQYTSAEVRPPN